jgi:hypothetical protein
MEDKNAGKTCLMCKKVHEIDVTTEQLHDWSSGTMIQDAMPNLSDSDREILISGICGKCYDEIFREEED